MKRSKLENTVLGMIDILRKSIQESDGRLTIGEKATIVMLKGMCDKCLKISDARNELEEFMKDTTEEES